MKKGLVFLLLAALVFSPVFAGGSSESSDSGKDQLLWLYESAAADHEQHLRTDLRDTTGAGDTFLGYFLFSILSGRSTLASFERATLASSIAVTRDGAMESIPFYPDVDNYFIV